MSKIRKRISLSLFILSVCIMGISVYFYAKAETISSQVWAKYGQFVNENALIIGGEAHFNEQDEKRAVQLLEEVINNKEKMISTMYSNFYFFGIRISIIFFLAGLFTITYNFLKKSTLWLYSSPQRLILYSAFLLFLFSCLFPPFIHSGHIYYSFIMTPFWNGSRIFWALMLIEWAIVLLPLGLTYNRLRKSKQLLILSQDRN